MQLFWGEDGVRGGRDIQNIPKFRGGEWGFSQGDHAGGVDGTGTGEARVDDLKKLIFGESARKLNQPRVVPSGGQREKSKRKNKDSKGGNSREKKDRALTEKGKTGRGVRKKLARAIKTRSATWIRSPKGEGNKVGEKCTYS